MPLAPIFVSLAEMAHALDLDERTVQKLATAGLVIRVKHGEFDLIASMRIYAAHLRKMAAQHASMPAKERALEV